MAKRKPTPSSSELSAQVDAAVANVRRPKERVSAQATARVSLLSGLIEATLVLMELMLGLTFVRGACEASYRTLNSLPAGESPPPFNNFCIHVTANLVVIAWFVFRMSQKHQPTTTVQAMADKLNLWPLPRKLSPDTMTMLKTVFALHFVGTATMTLIQYLTGHWIFSFQNYYDEDMGMDYVTTADMLLLAPLREELTFRGLIFAIFYLRGVAFKIASPAAADASSGAAVTPASDESLAWTSSWKLDCVVASSLSFGVVHLLNLFGLKYTTTYIVLQVFLGMTLGAFYSFRFVLSENALLETVLLHMINNLFSSFLPIQQELDLTDPLVAFPLMLTFVVYGTLVYQQYRKLRDLPSQPFTVLSETASTEPATAPSNEAKDQ